MPSVASTLGASEKVKLKSIRGVPYVRCGNVVRDHVLFQLERVCSLFCRHLAPSRAKFCMAKVLPQNDTPSKTLALNHPIALPKTWWKQGVHD
jgi:hypothetical protein